jgi:hypothetical protein
MAKPGASLSFITAVEEMQCSTLVVGKDFDLRKQKGRAYVEYSRPENKLSCWLFQLERARDQIGLVADAA